MYGAAAGQPTTTAAFALLSRRVSFCHGDGRFNVRHLAPADGSPIAKPTEFNLFDKNREEGAMGEYVSDTSLSHRPSGAVRKAP